MNIMQNWSEKSKKLLPIILAVIIILAPSNLFFKLYEGASFVNGLQVDYLIPKIHLSDIFILAYIFLWLITQKKQYTKKTTLVAVVFTLFFLANLLASSNKIATFWYQIKLVEMGLFTLALWQTKKQVKPKYIIFALFSSLILQLIVSIYQFSFQKPVFDYHILGETNLRNYANISKGYTFGKEQILAYGTTAHPNILAGFSVIAGLWLIRVLVKKSKQKKEIFLIISIIIALMIIVFLTQSLSAGLSLLLGVIFLTFQSKLKQIFARKNCQNIYLLIISAIIILSPVLLNLISSEATNNHSLNRRNYLNQSAWQMIANHPVLGVGVNNFTSHVEKYSNNREVVRFVQPAHHVGLLLWAEIGALGMIILGLVMMPRLKNQNRNFAILILLPVLIMDHYLITQQTGLLILALLIGIDND